MRVSLGPGVRPDADYGRAEFRGQPKGQGEEGGREAAQERDQLNKTLFFIRFPQDFSVTIPSSLRK